LTFPPAGAASTALKRRILLITLFANPFIKKGFTATHQAKNTFSIRKFIVSLANCSEHRIAASQFMLAVNATIEFNG